MQVSRVQFSIFSTYRIKKEVLFNIVYTNMLQVKLATIFIKKLYYFYA